MLGQAPVVPFVAITDGARARAFYEGVLGLRVVSDDAFAVVVEANGTEIRLPKVQSLTPQPFTVLGFAVADTREMAMRMRDAGVVFERYAGMEQDDLGIWTPPGGAGMGVAWFKDPDGNLLSITGPVGG